MPPFSVRRARAGTARESKITSLANAPHPARPLVYAHRGGAALRPENTIEAFDHGLSLGADVAPLSAS